MLERTVKIALCSYVIEYGSCFVFIDFDQTGKASIEYSDIPLQSIIRSPYLFICPVQDILREIFCENYFLSIHAVPCRIDFSSNMTSSQANL